MSTFASDTFTGTGNLDAHTPDVGGGTWTKWVGDTMTIGGGVCGSDGGEGDYYNSTAPGNADETVSADLIVTSNNNYAGLLARFVDSSNYYGAGYDNGNGWWEVFKVVGGSFTRIGSASATLTVSSTYAMAFSVIGTTLTLKIGGVTTVGPLTDSGVSGAGHCGLYSASNRGVNGYQMDNWVAADSTGGAATKLPVRNRRPTRVWLRRVYA